MSKPIETQRQTIDEMRDRWPNFVRHLQRAGYVARVFLTSGVPASEAWENKDGRLVLVAGSRSLFMRYCRENDIKGVNRRLS